jgi:hypothetical protein
MSTGTEPIIHDVAGAAAFCKVTEDDIRRWIREGLKARPVSSGRRGPVRYLIRQDWLLDWIDATATVAAPKGQGGAEPEPPARRRGPGADAGGRYWPK